ncbi:MAG TPA: hypothetical protein VKV23_09640 [Acidimicrobiales bacterium]|nr:hypothetical protein [Acidimicrobiales bacterium]
MARVDANLAAIVRRVVAVASAAAIAGMIAAAATHHLGGVIALGCVSSGAIVALMVAVAVGETPSELGASVDAEAAREVEALVAALVEGGADEAALRRLVGAAARLRGGPPAG